MASRFNQRDARSSLFSSYDAQAKSRPTSASPGPSRAPPASSYPYASNSPSASFGAYPQQHQQRSAGTPPSSSTTLPLYNDSRSGSKPAYNQAVLESLESQNDAAVSEMSKRVAMLKDITMRIGDEIRDSTALAEKMNDGFGSAGLKLKGTMNRMLRMAERTGVGWRVWLGFFAAVVVLFWYVWLF